MPAYLIAQSHVKDPEMFKKYQEAARPIVRQYGGRPLTSGTVEVLEGAHDGRRFMVFEFPSIDHIRAFFTSTEYQKAKKIREGIADMNVWTVNGL